MLEAIVFHEDGSRSVIVDGQQKRIEMADLTDAERVEALEASPPSTAPVVPAVVTRFQARSALHLAGMLQTVEALMNDPQTDALARIAWQDALEFRRGSPTVAAMAMALGLSSAQIDQLFITAGGIEA